MYHGHFFLKNEIDRFVALLFLKIPFRWAFDSPGPGYFKTGLIYFLGHMFLEYSDFKDLDPLK